MKLIIKDILKENKEDRENLMLKRLSLLIEPPLYKEVKKVYPNIQEVEFKRLMEYYFNVDKVTINWIDNDYQDTQFVFSIDNKTVLQYRESEMWKACGISVSNYDYVLDYPVMDISFSEGVVYYNRGRDVLYLNPYDLLNEIRNGTFDVGNYFNKNGRPKITGVINSGITGTINESVDRKDIMINTGTKIKILKKKFI